MSGLAAEAGKPPLTQAFSLSTLSMFLFVFFLLKKKRERLAKTKNKVELD